MIKFFSAFCSLLLLVGCSNTSEERGLKVAASAVPHAQLLEFIKPDLKEKGIDLIIVVTADYNMPNRALANKEVDANFFQHIPFMEEQIKQFDYPIQSLAKIEIEPMGLYSSKIKSLSELVENSVVAVPNDPTNEARSLRLLQEYKVIQLDDPNNLQATILNIKKNPPHLDFLEIDAAMLPRSLPDVDVAAINTNYAMEANLSLSDALAKEGPDSPYANIIAIRVGDENRPDIQALKEAMTSEKMKQFILHTYKGNVIPAF